mmetsp:Transcript_20588/g.24521  ORF Transcript_20588/g.24521 Transcript_20588/m.24521 type:complete len:266 (+) Transcript_20588:58-855(+)|eukprot:CAMPEP_0198255638 /NCGR_PEP_ID=MMETSP1447-20131203/5708_1 /TAXON_ID=420782 /ORGANISM="Chaetoceros dichaeta, Strain CCMP1751" /LENGTH=265 /DNA_ID=CAMNT_0043942049 /DNA_START=43 /DNA_END=840 /DNA_ORIENTATION=-
MAPAKFSDITKTPKDILNEDYTSKVTLKCKKDAGPILVTIDSDRSAAGALSSKIGGKFSYAGLSIDKIQHDSTGNPILETSLSPQPGMKVSFKGGVKNMDLGCDYKTGSLCTTAKFDVKNMSKVSASATYGHTSGIILGGSSVYNNSKGVEAFDVGASYGSGPLFAAVTSSGKGQSLNLTTMYKATPDLTLATSTNHSASTNLSLVAVGGVYKAPFGNVKAKYDGDGVLSACLIKDIAPKVKLTASGSITGTDTSTFKYGMGITM